MMKNHNPLHDQQFNYAVHTITSEMIFIDAVKDLELLANAGHQHSAQYLAELYRQGFRVEKDSAKALHWQEIATLVA